ncbi:MAG: hypothetical protein QG566_282 [Patescibacteria group bacterium]|nr:hypothetical protein [Patescibacteria group bacterium]
MNFFLQISTTDKFWFLVIQLIIVFVSIWAFYFDKKPKIGVITRGEESQRMLTNSHRLVFGVILIAIFSLSNYPKNGKLFYFISDLILCTYWCFYSTWFTNKIVGIITAFQKRQYR